MSDIKWNIIEVGKGKSKITHIMPTIPPPEYATEEEAASFIEAIKTADFPIILTKDNMIHRHYLGHRRSKECPCLPESKIQHGRQCYVHHVIQ